MPPYIYELPSTGAFSFSEECIDTNQTYTSDLAEATAARASLRTILKESRRTDGERDYLRIIKTVDDYLNQLYAVTDCAAQQEITFRTEPVFSWRSTLSSSLIHSSPRVSFPSLQCDLTFTLITYGFALSNLSSTVVTSLGNYELERHTTDSDRQAKDERLNFAANLLCRASGVFLYISDTVLPEWEKAHGTMAGRPPELTKEVTQALSKLALADAQVLAIRKLMSRSAYDSTLMPGPPLPKSHPSPALIAKLYINISVLYSSARSLAKTQPSKSTSGDAGVSDVHTELRHYLADESAFSLAMAYKWLGVDAGEQDGKAGISVAFLKLAKEGLDSLREGKLRMMPRLKSIGTSPNDRAANKDRVVEEISAVKTFLHHYKGLNDSVHFLPVLSSSEAQSLVPSGRSALALKPFTPPAPSFGPRSVNAIRNKASNLLISDEGSQTQGNAQARENEEKGYGGEGSYF